MYQSFELFIESRENNDFNQQFHEFCGHIVESGLYFEAFWNEVALPTLFENPYEESEEMILENMIKNEGLWDKAKSWMNNRRSNLHGAEPDVRQDSINRKGQELINQVKQNFETHLGQFLRNTQELAYKDQGKHAPVIWKAARVLHDRAKAHSDAWKPTFTRADVNSQRYKGHQDAFNAGRTEFNNKINGIDPNMGNFDSNTAINQKSLNQPSINQNVGINPQDQSLGSYTDDGLGNTSHPQSQKVFNPRNRVSPATI